MAEGYLKIDVHGHLGEWYSASEGRAVPAMLAALRKWGIERCIVSSARALLVDTPSGNREVEALVEAHQEFLGYVYVDPTHPDESVKEIERYARHPRFVGIKSRPEYHNSERFDSPAYRTILQAAVANRMRAALIHFWDPTPPNAHVAMAEEFDFPIILAHAGGNLWRQCIDCVAGHQNIYLDFCCSIADAGKIEYGLAAVGADRILFGTDLMLIHPAWTMGIFLDAGLGDGDLRKIFRENAIRVFQLDGL
jgi:predicted TIM-barrel fold metal-dependent hydrolase